MVRLMLLVAALAVAPSAQADLVVQGGAQLNVGFLNADFMHGYEFVTTQAGVVHSLGFWDSGADGLPRGYEVGLWETATQTLLDSATIDNSDALDTSLTLHGGQWRTQSLVTPIPLAAGTSYTLGFMTEGAILPAADALILSSAGLSTAAAVDPGSFIDRTNGSGSYTFPDNVSASPIVRANVNALISAVPEPTVSVGIAVTGVLLWTAGKRRGPQRS